MLPPLFKAWADQIAEGFRLKQQYHHKLMDCPVARNSDTKICHLCVAWEIRKRQEAQQ